MSENSSTADVAAIGIGKSFGSFRALKDVSFTIRAGEFLTLLGPSGSGKTTLLMILAGFEAPSEGRLLRNGADITHMPAEQRAFGMVFQGYALFPHLSVQQNVAFPLQVRGLPQAQVRRRVAEMLLRVGLDGQQHKLPAQLSGGQQQRVALARALVFQPALLLLDEPFSALDRGLRASMQNEVKRLHQELGTTFVFVTHDQSEALSLSSRVAIFNRGELLQLGAPQAVYERPVNRFVAEFLGEINLLPLRNVGHGAIAANGHFEDASLAAPARPDCGVDALLAVRPEHMSLATARPGADNGIAASLRSATYLGAVTRLGLATRGGTALTLTLPTERAAAAIGAGEELWVTWPIDKGFLLPASAPAGAYA